MLWPNIQKPYQPMEWAVLFCELQERHLVWAVLHGPGGAVRELGRPQPEAVVGAAGTGVMPIPVPCVHYPKAGRVNVRVEKGVGHPGEDCQVVLQGVVQLDSIFKEYRKSFDIEDDISLNHHV